MPTVEREDGVELHWRASGHGPAVVIGDNVFSIPEALDPLEAELVADHTVIRYDPRGAGASTHSGPYDLETDLADFCAVLEAAGAGPAVAIGPANGVLVATLCAARRPDLVTSVVAPVGAPVATLQLGQGLASSREVLESIGTQMASDYRGLIRSITTTGNPQYSEEERRLRVEAQVKHCPQETALGRWEAYRRADTTQEAVELGDRLWILLHPGMPWWPVEQAEPLREIVPDAHVEVVEDGPLSRPDITAGVVRRITGGPSAE
jgi:pimeloyl-ACP methyl ester carboxylesterase